MIRPSRVRLTQQFVSCVTGGLAGRAPVTVFQCAVIPNGDTYMRGRPTTRPNSSLSLTWGAEQHPLLPESPFTPCWSLVPSGRHSLLCLYSGVGFLCLGVGGNRSVGLVLRGLDLPLLRVCVEFVFSSPVRQCLGCVYVCARSLVARIRVTESSLLVSGSSFTLGPSSVPSVFLATAWFVWVWWLHLVAVRSA